MTAAEGDAEQPVVAEQPFLNSVRISMASTTSTDNSGLFAAVLPLFEQKTGIGVDVIAVGTGNAIALGKNGDVDIILVHARSQEDQFIADGYGVNRRDVMHNDFVLLGPASDPAGIGVLSDAGAALTRIAASGNIFVSRGDDSGTHVKELSLWDSVGIDPGGTWYREAGQGMGAVLIMADELNGYTLADRGTYIAMQDSIDLQVVAEGDERLFNPYGIIAVNPSRHPHVQYESAMQLIAFFTSITGQKAINNFMKNGQQLFYPDAVAADLLR
ncbi:MAG: substrate-binding domain-containing protein [Spirochaetia bacterium]|nr:substrate-binding domain-containing protein [Spirochaetia bacterium]